MIQPASVYALLGYWELRVGNNAPTTTLLLENMKTTVRLSDFFAILYAFGGLVSTEGFETFNLLI